MNLTEDVKEAIRRVVAAVDHVPMRMADPRDLNTYARIWGELRHEVSGYDRDVSAELRQMVKRLTRYNRPWVV